MYEGYVYKAVSYAYQAARSSEQYIREKIYLADNVMEMYEIAAKIEDPPEWNKKRTRLMEQLIRDKFRRNGDLRDKLKATENRELINSYADETVSNLFWGMVDGRGQNQLGRILEMVRSDIHNNLDLEKWIFMTFDLEKDKNLLPVIKLECLKSDQTKEEIKLEGKSYYTLGKLAGSDVLMTHQSISRRHACLICDAKDSVCLVDLSSKAGSFVDGAKVEGMVAIKLKTGSVINFGASTRKYTVIVDYSHIHKYLESKKKNLDSDLKILEQMNDPNASADVIKASLGVVENDTIFVSGLPDNPSNKAVQFFFG